MARKPKNQIPVQKAPVSKVQKSKETLIFMFRAIILLSVMMLLVYFIALLSGYRPFFDTTSGYKSVLELNEDIKHVDRLIEKHKSNLSQVAYQLAYADSKQKVDNALAQWIGSQDFGDIHYFSQGTEYSSTGMKVQTDPLSITSRLARNNQAAFSQVYRNGAAGQDCVAIYIPVKGSAYVDGVMSIIPARNLIDMSQIRREHVSVTALVGERGQVYSHSLEEDFPVRMENNYVDFIKTLSQNKESSNQVQKSLGKSDPQVCHITGNGEFYTVSISPLRSTDYHLWVVNLTLGNRLTATEMTFIRQIVVVSVIAIIALLITLFFAFLFHTRVTRMLMKAAQTAPELGCANATQFRRKSGEILSASDSSNWYVICAEVRQFGYISTQYGYDIALQQLKYIAKILQSVCTGREFFGYAEDGIFQILLHCKDEPTFHNRIQVISGLIGKSVVLKELGIVNGLYIGAYGVGTHRDLPIGEILEYASSARTMAKSDVQKPYVLYTDEIRDELKRNDQIEAQMEEALATGEFKLFLQPKYNVKRDCVDSAEALVRWFDPRRNDYIFPVEFIPLFESNGFVTKLDHFMYLEVCKYFQNAVERGDKIIPIAVNVSRVTAMRPDFLDFYVGNKEKYGIADGFITIEMTESFAMQNYEAIEKLVIELHKHGIRCSIDDFGSGYSSFEILKKIPMDELKMDRIFIADGIEKEQDLLLIQTVINLGKAMGMSVVQEGIETREIFDQLCDMGCDVIQGYYYARAIPLEEYRIFIRTNTSIRYKARVK